MATTDINFRLNLDEANLMGDLNAMRSRITTMFGTAAADFGGAMSGLSQFGQAATAGFGMMRTGLHQGMSLGTATDPAMAYSMHHGMLQAQSTFGQEMQSVGLHPWEPAHGLAGGAPPGVGAADYTRMIQGNFGRRLESAASGAMGGVVTGVASMAGWGASQWLAGKAGIKGLAGLGVGLVGSMAVDAVVGKGIERGNQIFSEVQDLGRIATAGRGMSLSDTHEFGRGFRGMSKRMGISTEETRDIIAGIRQSGMMPPTRDVQQSLSQFETMAKEIRDIAVGMQTSLSTATRYLKDVERLGMGRGSGGVFAAAQMAEGLGTSLGGLISHVGQGQRMGMAAGIGAGAGGQLALGSAFAGAAGLSGLTGGEQRMVGGAMGLGRAFQMQALQNALGPWGQMQGMAMMGPTGAQALPGTAMGTIDQAAANIFGGGDPISNMVEFTTGRKRMLSQMGGRGIRMMQAQAIQTQANMLRELSPNLSEQRALQFTGMQMGLGEHQARAMAGFIQRGFRDPRPSSRAVGMPAVFAGGAGGAAAIRAGRETQTRQLYAEHELSSRMPWTRAIDAIGNAWAGVRQDMAEGVDRYVRNRQMEQGIAVPTESALAEAQEGFRRGTGMLASTGVDLSAMGSVGGAAMQTVLAFGGASAVGGIGAGIAMPGGKVITAAAAKKAMEGLGTQIGRLSRGSIDQSTVTEAAVVLGSRMEGNAKKFKTIGENLRHNLLKATGGSEDSTGSGLKWLSSDIKQVLRGTEFEKDFEKQGIGMFGSKKGAEAMALINRFVRAQTGDKGFDIGETISKAGAVGIGATALAIETKGMEMVEKLMGGTGDVQGEAKSIIKESEEKATKRAMKGIGLSGAFEGGKKGRGQALVEARERIAKRPVKGVEKRVGRAILRSKSFQDYMKAREVLYYKPWRDAKKRGETGEALKARARKEIPKDMEDKMRKAVIREAQASILPGAAKAARTMLKNIDKDSKVSKSLADAVDATVGSEKKGRRRRRKARGRVVAFQSQQESFQSQVATALKKTAHVLDRIKDSLPPKK